MTRYEEAWEAINRLIRGGGSWSGHERNCVYRNASDTRSVRFANVSGSSGLDLADDARAIAEWDFDRDGDPDLLVKNRSGPQLRIWRNDAISRSSRISVLLRGTLSNRQGVGARVVVETAALRRTKEKRAGSGFLTQCGTDLLFGLGDASRVERLTVRWPSGRVDEHRDLAVGRRYTIVEGERSPRSEAFATPVPVAGASAERWRETFETSAVRRKRPWLADPVPLTPFAWKDPAGRTSHSRAMTESGRAWVLSIGSVDCARCLGELREWSEARTGGGEAKRPDLIFLVPDDESVDRLAEIEKRTGITTRRASRASLLELAILIEELVHWPRELSLPLNLLVDGAGRMVRLYDGPVSWAELVADVAAIPADDDARLRAALPFAGRFHAADVYRSEFQLGVSYLEAGLPEAALAAFERTLARRGDESEALYNAGLIYLGAGALAPAEKAFLSVLEQRPEFVDAQVNLGVVFARRGQFDRAAERFEAALRTKSDHLEAVLNLGNVELDRGRIEEALARFRRAAEIEPDNAIPHKRIGTTLRAGGDLAGARRAYERATQLDGRDAEAWGHLAVILAEGGELDEALEAIERAIENEPTSVSIRINAGLILAAMGKPARAESEMRRAISLDPLDPIAYLNLAMMHARGGATKAAREVLRELLLRVPGEPRASELLRRLSP